MGSNRHLTLVRSRGRTDRSRRGVDLPARASRPGEEEPVECQIGSLLVRLPNWVGDVCMALPLIQALRDSLPRAHLAALARPFVAGLARLFPFDEVIPLDDRGPLWIRPWQLRRAGTKLRSRKFDAAVTLPTSVSSALLLRMAGIQWTVGYGRGPVRYLLSNPLPYRQAKDLHRAHAYLKLVEGLALACPELRWAPPPLTAERISEGKRRLAPAESARHRVGLGIGSVGESRRWPAASYASLADRLVAELGAAPVLVGGPADQPIAQEVLKKSSIPILNLVGQTRLEEMPGLMAALDLIVANDSGAAHLAALASTPTLVFFGAGDPKITAPLSSGTRVLRHPLDCSPCGSNRCKLHLECMTSLTVDQVVDEVRRVLASIGEDDHGQR